MSDSSVQNVKNGKKQLRRRQIESDDGESDSDKESGFTSIVEEMRLLQKLRKRPNGVNIVGLASGRKIEVEENSNRDPFNVKSGGMVNMKALKSGQVTKVDDAYDTGIGTQFSAETNKRDEDEEMMKYIEEQLSKKKGVLKTKVHGDNEPSASGGESINYCSPEEAALQAVPDHLRVSSTQRSEEMLSNQMLSGIPEVDLGIDAKIRNIEATEEAKLRLLWNKHNAKEGPSQFVPTNITVNFTHQNKINVDESEGPGKAGRVTGWKKPTGPEVRVPQKRKDGEKATDDYHYEKFKKQFRRY